MGGGLNEGVAVVASIGAFEANGAVSDAPVAVVSPHTPGSVDRQPPVASDAQTIVADAVVVVAAGGGVALNHDAGLVGRQSFALAHPLCTRPEAEAIISVVAERGNGKPAPVSGRSGED